MTFNINIYYLIVFLCAFIITLLTTPLMRIIALKCNILDHPHSSVKTHDQPVPYLGGIAIWLGFMFSLVMIRIITNFPSGTLHNLRGILLGGLCIVLLGIIDDLNPKGIDFKKKFVFQFIAALILIYFGIHIKFVHPNYISIILTIIWVIGISNAFNIVDIMDGLSSSLAVISAGAFLIIALPTEQFYVNFAAAALAGACLGFIPFNMSKSRRIFMGDTGSLFIGFVLASLSLGTSYTQVNDVGLFAPILILGIPIYDTMLVMFYRIIQNKSPFLGSKDHFALRLEAMGFTRKQILTIACVASIVLAIIAFVSTRVELVWALLLYILVGAELIFAGFWFYRVKMHG